MSEPQTRRVIVSGGWQITQVPDGDGGWWNIRVERIAR